MIEEIRKGFPVIGVILALLAMAYSLQESIRSDKLAAKNELFESYVEWQRATFRLRCFYLHKEDKTSYPKDIIENYPMDDIKFEEAGISLRDELALLSRYDRKKLAEIVDERLLWTYNLYYIYRKDLLTIKMNLSDDELVLANRNCAGEI